MSINTNLCAEHSNSASQVDSPGSCLLISHPGDKIAHVGVDNVSACFRGILDQLNAPHLPATLSHGPVSLHSQLRKTFACLRSNTSAFSNRPTAKQMSFGLELRRL